MTADPPSAPDRLARFTLGDWLVDPRACQVSRGETAEKLRPQLIALLVCLARRQGKIVLKSEILSEVWPGQFIADSGLSRCIAELRQALHDDAQEPTFIETVPKRGYRLIAPIAWDTEETPSLEPAGGHTLQPAPAPSHRRARWWVTGGLILVLAGLGVVAFQATRPPARVLTGRDTVMLADVTNSTSERVFDDALNLALAVNLEQAPFLRILPQDAVRSALRLAGRPADERVTGALALEVCRREGAAVVLTGSIAALGSRYAVGIEAVACESGESVGHALEEATSRERVLPALDRAAARIRERLGESRDPLRQHDVPLVQATTASLEALRALTQGDVHRNAGRHADALRYYRQATELDPEFALAWARRGVTARNIDLRDEAIPAIRRAFELVGRVSQPERFFIEGLYYRLVEGDPQKALDSHQAWRTMYPGSPIPVNGIASTLSDEMGRYEDAIPMAREALRLAPNNGLPYNNLVQALVAVGQRAEATQVADEAVRRGIDEWTTHVMLWEAAAIEGDSASMEREYQWATKPPSTLSLWMRVKACTVAGQGRLAEARRLWDEALTEAARAGNAPEQASVLFDRAESEALLGDRAAAERAVGAALAIDRGPMSLVRAGLVMGLLGNVARARPLVDEAVRAAAADPAPLKVMVPTANALIVSREGRPDAALETLQGIARYEKGGAFSLVPLGVRGMVSAAAGRPRESADAFGEFIRLRAVSFAPWIPVALLGRARALRDLGDTAGSIEAYDALLKWWEKSDASRMLQTAQQERRALAAGPPPHTR
jgi:eukaryotic-like serine/threonine-protein kinase